MPTIKHMCSDWVGIAGKWLELWTNVYTALRWTMVSRMPMRDSVVGCGAGSPPTTKGELIWKHGKRGIAGA